MEESMVKIEISDAQRSAVIDAVAEALGDAYDCMRVWSAWSYGTMGPSDFSLVADDGDRVAEIADAVIQALINSSCIEVNREEPPPSQPG
jgi:hypothetical protein